MKCHTLLGRRVKSPAVRAPCFPASTGRLSWPHRSPSFRFATYLYPVRAGMNSNPSTRDSPRYWSSRLEQARSLNDIKSSIDHHKINRPGGDLDLPAVLFAVDALAALARVARAQDGVTEIMTEQGNEFDQVRARHRSTSIQFLSASSVSPSSQVGLCIGWAWQCHRFKLLGSGCIRGTGLHFASTVCIQVCVYACTSIQQATADHTELYPSLLLACRRSTSL